MVELLLISALFIALVGSLVFSDWPAIWIFSCAMLFCYFVGFVDTAEVLDKASNTGLITLLLLLMVTVGLEKLSWLNFISSRLISARYYITLLRICGVTAFFSAFVNNTAVVATLANVVRSNPHHAPSRLLIPLSYAAILGGTTTIIGTSTNLIVSSFLEDATGQGLAFFDFFVVGIAAACAGLLALMASVMFLPKKALDDVSVNEYLIEADVEPHSSMVGKSLFANQLRSLESLFLVEIVRGDHLISPVAPTELIQAGDKLIFSGDVTQLGELESFDGLSLFAGEQGLLSLNLSEVIVMPNATVEGKTIKASAFRSQFDAAIVGMRRGGKRLSGKLGNIALQAGDSLMLAVGPDFSQRKNLDKNFVVINDGVPAAKTSLLQNFLVTFSLVAVIVLAAMNIVSLIKGLAFVLLAMLVIGVVRGSELRRRFPFELWLIITSALVLAQALTNSGLVILFTDSFHAELVAIGPHAAIAGIFLFTLVLTELMTNNAAAALSFPVAFSLAESYGLSHMPFIMAVAFGASASFLTPYGYTTNLMVQNLGGYTLRDYFFAGLPVSIAYSVCVVGLIPVVFPFV